MTIKFGFKHKLFLCAFAFIASAAFALIVNVEKAQAQSASLFLSPGSGTFVVDSTFEVSVYLDTKGNSVNTIDLAIKFPPDKLQLVSSGIGKSIIGLWTSQPKYNNQTGLLELTGGVPGGVNVSRGLITTMTFRVKAVGQAVVKFDRTRILLNDGEGTEVVTNNQNSLYDLILPPPAGPIVVSETHPDQSQWYKNNTVSFRWGEEAGVEGYSYILNNVAQDIPDEISEGVNREVVYRNLSDGRRYFHIRALRNGRWGGTTHYALNIDSTAPADFKIEVVPDERTTRTQPVLQFSTTDALSGFDHYELKIVSLTNPATTNSPQDQSEEIFIEVHSPFITNELQHGTYDAIVRAYDKAGNYREVVQKLEIVPALFRHVGERGLEIRSTWIVPWWALMVLVLVLIVALGVLARRMHLWHKIGRKPETAINGDIRKQMEELQKYRAKYGKIAVVLLMAISLAFGSGKAQAQDSVRADVFDTPLITTLSKNISNEEIFYIGGRSGKTDSDIIIYIQNVQTTETISETVKSNKEGEWFYRHDAFLPSGLYVLWVQGRVGAQMSPPSPQVQIEVESTAIQLGATRISHTTLYMTLLALALLVLVSLVIYILRNSARGRRKHSEMMKEILEAQESIRRGFAVLNRDIQAELEVIKRAKLGKKLTKAERDKEKQLLQDLQDIEQYVTKEVWDIEQVQQRR